MDRRTLRKFFEHCPRKSRRAEVDLRGSQAKGKVPSDWSDPMNDAISFTPDAEVKVHAEGAIRHLCAPFRSHEDGLPEWIKNSSDAYARLDIQPDEAFVLVLLQDGKSGGPPMVGCLDFGGMSTLDIENKFRHWADPTAAGEDDRSRKAADRRT
jgi:hypothetical protein